MDERIYRILLVCLTAVQLLILVTVSAPLLSGSSEGEPSLVRIAIRTVGYLLVPVAVAGLWNWERWGRITLGIATAIAVPLALDDDDDPSSP